MRDADGDDDDSDDDDDANPGVRSWLERGNGTAAHLSFGAFVGAIAALGVLSRLSRIAYDVMTHGERNVFWFAVAAFVVAMIFMPGKRFGVGPRGLLLGFAPVDGAIDWLMIAASAAVAFGIAYGLGRLT
jgi:hypothetical protein